MLALDAQWLVRELLSLPRCLIPRHTHSHTLINILLVLNTPVSLVWFEPSWQLSKMLLLTHLPLPPTSGTGRRIESENCRLRSEFNNF